MDIGTPMGRLATNPNSRLYNGLLCPNARLCEISCTAEIFKILVSDFKGFFLAILLFLIVSDSAKKIIYNHYLKGFERNIEFFFEKGEQFLKIIRSTKKSISFYLHNIRIPFENTGTEFFKIIINKILFCSSHRVGARTFFSSGSTLTPKLKKIQLQLQVKKNSVEFGLSWRFINSNI